MNLKPGLLDFYLFPLSDWRQAGNCLSGGNARHILAVIQAGDASEELQDLLGKILSAVKISLQEDILLLKATKGESLSFASLSRAYPIQYVLLFGVGPQQLGLHLPLVRGQAVPFGPAVFLHTYSLPEIFEERNAGQRPKAAELWMNLKQLFPKTEKT